LEKKVVKVNGFKGPEEARNIVTEGMKDYIKYMEMQEELTPQHKSPNFQSYVKNFIVPVPEKYKEK
jgi:hypothetical protein